MNESIKGIGVSGGIAIGIAFWLPEKKLRKEAHEQTSPSANSLGIEDFKEALKKASKEIEAIPTRNDIRLSEEEKQILEIQLMFLTDPQLEEDVLMRMTEYKENTVEALRKVSEHHIQMLTDTGDAYLQARTTDLKDVADRIYRHLMSEQHLVTDFPENTVLLAKDLAPIDTITLDLSKIIGFATELGGKTSHTAIIAKGKGIPALVGCGSNLQKIKSGTFILLDGHTGELLENPDPHLLLSYQNKQTLELKKKQSLRERTHEKAFTTDGTLVKICGNISDVDGLQTTLHQGGDGVGLFRSELLFMNRTDFPSEEEQYQYYKEFALVAGEKPVVIRTLDIGGDKPLNYFNHPIENNPFLGYRAIRISLDQPSVFLAQLKAILRAGVYGNLRVMFPMISNLSELLEAKKLLNQAGKILSEEHKDFNRDIKTGMMIEIPSAAMMVDLFAPEVDFFSIGTNDLCQYGLAVDRMNEKVTGLYNHFNPGILRLIRQVISEARMHEKEIAMCGEMAADPAAVKLLLGLGLQEFSVNPGSIPEIKHLIQGTNLTEAIEHAQMVMKLAKEEEIEKFLKSNLHDS